MYVAQQVIQSCLSWCHLNIKNELGRSVRHLATLTNQPYILLTVLYHGVAVDQRYCKGNTALHIASREGIQVCAVALTRFVTKRADKENLLHSTLPNDTTDI